MTDPEDSNHNLIQQDHNVRVPQTPPVPEGMSKNAWKKELRKRKNESMKEEWALKRKEKKQAQKLEKKRLRDEDISTTPSGRPKRPRDQEKVPITVILDCGFDDLMTDRERTSLAIQINRCYSENRRAIRSVDLQVSSFNKGLKERFYGPMKAQHLHWRGVKFLEDDYQVPHDTDRSKWLYFSSDSSNTLETLDENMTYIIGGIVDKGRYKDLCKDKAEKHNISTARLPIDQYIKLSGRRVLTTNHVFEILLKWLELRNWKDAFESVLPPRKLIAVKQETKPEDEDEVEENSDQRNNISEITENASDEDH